jgi:hypothetical protein
VTDKQGRLFHLRHNNEPTESTSSDLTTEHRYYYEPDDASLRPRVIGYTAVVGPISDKLFSDNIGLQIGLVNVSDRIRRNQPLVVGPLQTSEVNNKFAPLTASEDTARR